MINFLTYIGDWVITYCYIISPFHIVEKYENLNDVEFFDVLQTFNNKKYLKLSGDYLLWLE